MCINSNEYPSGGDDATFAVPIVPPAPTVFSTTNCWLRTLLMPFARMRAITSAGPPAANGTVNITGLDGKSCAAHFRQAPSPATTDLKSGTSHVLSFFRILIL